MTQAAHPTPYLELNFAPNTKDAPAALGRPIRLFQAWLNGSQLVDENQAAIDLKATLLALESEAAEKGYILAGYLGYEATHPCHGIISNKPKACDIPDVWFGLFDPEADKPQPCAMAPSARSDNGLAAQQSQAEYNAALNAINHYIHSGDCYQINYTQLFQSQYSGCTYAAYTELLSNFNAPFAAYLRTAHGELLSFSPEQFIQIDSNRRIETKPIKGTTPRYTDSDADTKAATDLQSSTKNRAENLMIVDLLRNDLNKVCEPKSVTTDKLFAIESYTNVHHLVSTVSGQLRESISPCEALLSCFPGGSITGAPKLRAMEIIEELEPVRRHAYCGSMFYKLPTGELNSNIMIRTVISDESSLYCWAGGGIVADSTPAEEYQECLDKVGKILRHFKAKE